jgi:hypothetical protein
MGSGTTVTLTFGEPKATSQLPPSSPYLRERPRMRSKGGCGNELGMRRGVQQPAGFECNTAHKLMEGERHGHNNEKYHVTFQAPFRVDD